MYIIMYTTLRRRYCTSIFYTEGWCGGGGVAMKNELLVIYTARSLTWLANWSNETFMPSHC